MPAVSASGVRSPGEAGVALSVPTYFHETVAFHIVFALVAAGALWAAYRLRTRQLRARQAELVRLVDERTHELVRSQQETERALSIVEAQAEDLRFALEGGADDYIMKPLTPRNSRLRVGNLLAARRRLEERLREEGRDFPLVDLGLAAHRGDPSFAGALEEVLAEHMADEDFGVAAMAKALAMSRATLYRKTQDTLGVAPMEILWRFRLRQAGHLLRQTDATVSEVAYACGFKTVPHFTRRFRDLFGRTPAAYREAPGSPTPGF